MKTRHHGRAAKFAAAKKITGKISAAEKTEPPKKLKKVIKMNHPTYKIMVIDALKALDNNKACSIISIKKAMESKYTGLEVKAFCLKKAIDALKQAKILQVPRGKPNSLQLNLKNLETSKVKTAAKKKIAKKPKRRGAATARPSTGGRTGGIATAAPSLFLNNQPPAFGGGLFGTGSFGQPPSTTVAVIGQAARRFSGQNPSIHMPYEVNLRKVCRLTKIFLRF